MSWNDFGDLASGIFVNEFDEDTDMATLTEISGWFSQNLGELNTLLFTSFSGSGNGVIQPTRFGLEESGIFKKLYLKHFYRKKARNVLKGIDSSVDFISIREGDTAITRTNKNEIANSHNKILYFPHYNLKHLYQKKIPSLNILSLNIFRKLI